LTDLLTTSAIGALKIKSMMIRCLGDNAEEIAVNGAVH
jgi:hypothetical protein